MDRSTLLLSFLFVIVNYVHANLGKTSAGDQSDLFSSTFQMQTLVKAEVRFVQQLKNYLEGLQTQVTEIDKFLKTHYADIDLESIEEDFEDYVSNPFSAFGVISRTAQAKATLLPIIRDDSEM